MRSPIELWYGDDIAAAIGQIDDGKIQSRLAARDRERGNAAFQRGHPFFQHIDRWIIDAAVAKSLNLKIEERGAMIRTVELVGHRLIDRYRHSLGRWLRRIAGVDGDGLRS